MNTRLIYEQVCKLTSFVKKLQLRFVKHLRKYLVVCTKGLKFRDMGIWQNL